MLRVAVITRYFPSSGEPVQGRSLYETLRILGRSAEVHVFYPNATYPRILRPRSRTYDNLDLAFRPPDVNVSYFNYPALPLVSRPLNGWIAAQTLLAHVRAFAPDVVFGCFLYPEGFAALRIGRRLGTPVVVMSIGSDLNRLGDPFCARRTRTVLKQADAILTVSDDLRKKAIAMGAPPATTKSAPNGCDLAIFRPQDRAAARARLGIDPTCEIVLYVGRMDLQKGLRELIQAAASLHPSRPRLHCYLVGKGPDRTAIEQEIAARNAGDFIHVVPGCAFDEVAVWMAAADLVTLPSYMEGFPNVIIEALACGRPVVATQVGGIPEVLNEACGCLVPPRNTAKLADALAATLDTSWDAATVSAHWKRSWSAAADELLDLFSELVASRKKIDHDR